MFDRFQQICTHQIEPACLYELACIYIYVCVVVVKVKMVDHHYVIWFISNIYEFPNQFGSNCELKRNEQTKSVDPILGAG